MLKIELWLQLKTLPLATLKMYYFPQVEPSVSWPYCKSRTRVTLASFPVLQYKLQAKTYSFQEVDFLV